MQTIQWLRQFVKVDQKSSLKDLSWKEVWKEDEHMIILRYGRTLESQQGYHIEDATRSRYLDDPNAYSLRYRWNYQQKLKIGINAEKYAGEPFFALSRRGDLIFIPDISKSIM